MGSIAHVQDTSCSASSPVGAKHFGMRRHFKQESHCIHVQLAAILGGRAASLSATTSSAKDNCMEAHLLWKAESSGSSAARRRSVTPMKGLSFLRFTASASSSSSVEVAAVTRHLSPAPTRCHCPTQSLKQSTTEPPVEYRDLVQGNSSGNLPRNSCGSRVAFSRAGTAEKSRGSLHSLPITKPSSLACSGLTMLASALACTFRPGLLRLPCAATLCHASGSALARPASQGESW